MNFFFLIPLMNRTLECRASADMTFLECLDLLNAILEEEGYSVRFNEHNVIYEISSGTRCSLYVSLKSLHVAPYMVFLIS